MSLGELITALAYVVGGAVWFWAARDKRLSTEGFLPVVAAGLFVGLVGAKLTELVAGGWPFSVSFSVAFDPRSGGRALFGGLVFGWIGIEIAKRVMGIRQRTGDLFALALPAGEAVGRIGCYLNGCCYGRACRLPWAIYQHGELRHPTQLYSAVSATLLFLILLAVRKRLRREGDLFLLYLLGFGISRFVIEFFRAPDHLYGGLSIMQWFCLELIAGTSVFWYAARRQRSEVGSKRM